MKQILIAIIILVIWSTVLPAQTGRISGVIVDQQSGEQIPFTSLAIYSTDNIPITGTVSDEQGRFLIEKLSYGTFKLLISFIGYQTDTIENLVIGNATPILDLGRIPLLPSIVSLKEVEVSGITSTAVTKIDRKVYRADDFATARGGTAVDILNKLPSISVDPDGTVSVRGTSDFMVYVNGKPSQLDPSVLLSQLSADQISNVEVISVPTAKYDAQGKGGIINIATKRSGVEGLSLSSNGLLGGAPWGHKTDVYSNYLMNDNRFGGGINLLYIKKNLNLSGGINYNLRNVNGMRSGDARLLQSDGSYYHMVASGERPEWYELFSTSVGFDLQLSEHSMLSGSYFNGSRTEGRSAFYVYHNYFGDIDKNPIPGIKADEQWIYNPNTDNRYGNFQTANLDYRLKFSKNLEMNISGLYEHSGLSRALDNRNYHFDHLQNQPGSLEKNFIQTDNTPLDGFRLSLDVSKGFHNGHKLSAGLQPQFMIIAGSFGYDTLNVVSDAWAPYARLENAIDMKRGIYAGYLDYSGSLGSLEFMAGIRLEYTDQLMSIENPDYFSIFERETKSEYQANKLDWFPSMHLAYTVNEQNRFGFAASRRINRPPVKNMAPFLYRRHYEVYVVGDPALEPEYLNNMELSYTAKLGSQEVNFLGFYRGTQNAVFRVNTVFEEENVLIRSYTNSGNTTALGAEVNANFQAAKFAKLFVGASLYQFHIEGDIFGFQENNQSLNWSLKSSVNIMITKAMKLNADIDWRSATVTAQGSNEMRFMSNLALVYKPQKAAGWEFSTRLLDFLGTNNEGLNTRAYDAAGVQIFYQETLYVRYGPIFEINASYTFNSDGKFGKRGSSAFGKDEF